jgi:hypothetical protein
MGSFVSLEIPLENEMSKALKSLGSALFAVMLTATAAAAQVTTGSIVGKIVDAQGGVLPGVTVTATHTPTGTSYEAVSGGDGNFQLLNVRVGGPYTVTAALAGFKDQSVNTVTVALGQDVSLTFKMDIASLATTVEVTAQAATIDTTRAGAGGNISAAQKESLPTISRSLIDIVRVNPYFNALTTNNTVTAVSVAGRNSRYNSIQIDGAANNDLFGLAETGTPGGQTDSQPISLDAVQEIQLVVSPYDVRQGVFSGGGINAITKSGSNKFSGSAFFYGRNQNWIGDGATGVPVSEFSDKQGGFSLGGPISKNKAFFFGNADWGRKMTPTGFCITGCGQEFRGDAALVDEFFSTLQTKYGYTVAGAKDQFSRTTNSDKFIGKVDVNLNRNNRLTVRHNYVNGLNDIGTASATSYVTPDGFYRIASKTNSTVAQLNTAFKNGVNELRVASTRVRDRRAGQPDEAKAFPRTTVRLASGIQITVGREAFSTANELDQDVIEVNDDFTMIHGKHTITVGTHNEFFKFRNLFIRDFFGTYTFNSLDFFNQGLAQQYDRSFSSTSNPQQAAKFGVNQLGVYVGDQWRAAPSLTVTAGVRLDLPMFPDTPTANPAAQSKFGYATDVAPGGQLWSPRVGFNYDLKGDSKQQIRGGVGLFSGRTPYVWLSNQYGNTGNEFTRIGASNNGNNRIPYVADATAQPSVVTGATGSSFSNEIDLVDPDYKYPSLVRGNLAFDTELPWGLVGSTEFLFTKNVQDIKYQNLNRATPNGTQALDGRPIFTRKDTSLGDVIFLTNSSEGSSWSQMVEVHRNYAAGYYFNLSYLYGQSKSIMDGTSSQAASNWGNVYVPGDPNNPPVARSVFDPGHRVNFSASYDVPTFKETKITVSAYYSGQSGRPFTLSYFGDVNGDGRTGNDLLYIPASASEVSFTGGSYTDLRTFVDADPCLAKFVGKIIPRNACRGPWTNNLDARIAVALPFKRVKADITLDILNVINLLDSKRGQQQYATFNQISPVTPTLSSGQITNYNIAFMTSSTFKKFATDDLRSRWQMQLGGRLRF